MRVARLAFHPSGKFIGTASFDTTWRLWDVETQKEVLLQEGHSREVFTIGFQNDGALVASAGLDSVGRIWDLRTGRSIMVLRSHIKPILALDWSPNGYQLATGGEDNTIRVWDIRAAKCFYTIPAHKSTVTQIRYWTTSDAFESSAYDNWTLDTPANEMNVDKNYDSADVFENGGMMRRHILDGSFIVSSSYDGTCKLWSDGDFKPLKSLTGLEGRIMCADISGGELFI
jgi:U4/U6 small nuclear ribonucleoprotein PRP4